jgi:hypothetical protein
MMFNHMAPVLLFTYKRLDVLKQTVTALQANYLAADTELFVFSDGYKNNPDKEKVELVRTYIKGISGFKNVVIYEASENKGLANSIIDGVSQVINAYEKVIVLEDDLVTSRNFLHFMNQCLEHYKDSPDVFSIAGYLPPMRKVADYPFDAFFFPRNNSHGWATWKDRWIQVDWDVPDYKAFIQDRKRRAEFNVGGSDLSNMLKRQMEGKMNSWSIRFCYQQYKAKTYTVYPVVSKIQNVGFGKEATHTNNYNRFATTLDAGDQTEFALPAAVDWDVKYVRNFQRFYSITARGIGKIKTYLNRLGLLKDV